VEREPVELIIEVLRRGRVRERVRLDRLPAYVGRAYSNDVIIEDPFVSPRHLILREGDDGRIVAFDLDSVNGMRVVANDQVVSEIPIEPGLRLRIGETTIRFATTDQAVPEAHVLRDRPSATLAKLKDARVAALAVIASFGVFLAEAYLEDYSGSAFADHLGFALAVVVALMVWAGVWAFVNRLLAHRFDFPRHWALACLAFVALVIVDTMSEYMQFATSWDGVGSVVILVGDSAVVGLLLYAHLSVIPSPNRRRRRWWSLAVSALFCALTVFFDYSSSREFSTRADFDVPLKRFGSEWIPTTSIDEFLAGARQTKEWVDSQSSEP
jgi:chromate transport protein ChrA